MKYSDLKLYSVRLCVVFTLLFIISSCQKDDNYSSVDSQKHNADNQRIMHTLCSHSIDNCDDIDINDNEITIYQDLSIEKESFLEYLDMLDNAYEPEPAISSVPHPDDPNQMLHTPIENVSFYDESGQPISETRQRIRSVLQFVKYSKASNITYYIMDSVDDDCKDGMVQIIEDAFEYWNNVEGINVNFTVATSLEASDIALACDTDDLLPASFKNLGDGGIARSPNSYYRTPGNLVAFSKNLINNQFGIAVHEIGHTLGLAHTDDPDPEKGWHMYKSAETDDASIMNSIVAAEELSEEDLLAVRRLWPEQLKKPIDVSFTKVGNMIKIKLKNPDHIVSPYNHINVGHVHNDIFKWGNWGHQPNDNGEYNIYWIKYFGPGKHSFYIQGASHNNEKIGTFSGWFHVYM